MIADVTGQLIVGTTLLAAKAAAGGAGIAFVEVGEARPMLERGELVQLLAPWTPPFEGHALYYSRNRLPSAAFRAFIDYFKARTSQRRPRRSSARPSSGRRKKKRIRRST